MKIWILLAALALPACDTSSNTILLPIGSRCTSSGDCGSSPFRCATTFPGGYCEKPCITNGDCPSNAACIVGACRLSCSDPAIRCRAAEGYRCLVESGTPVCDFPGAVAVVDAGTTD
jgi:hypothetical protein